MDFLFRELKTHSFKNIRVYHVSDTSGVLKWGVLVGEVCLARAIRGHITCRLKKLIKLTESWPAFYYLPREDKSTQNR